MTEFPMKEHALAWALKGYAIFPCNHIAGPDSKKPLTLNGFKDASREPMVIEAWWTRSPRALIGLPTGEVNSLCVVDVDRHPGKVSGFETLAELAKQGLRLPRAGITATTPNNGVHLYYRCPPGGMKSRNMSGVDVKCRGGYVIAPPSILSDGTKYEFVGTVDDILQ